MVEDLKTKEIAILEGGNEVNASNNACLRWRRMIQKASKNCAQPQIIGCVVEMLL